MIKNEDTYCTVYHKIVRELGAWEAVIYSTIASLLRKSDGIGEVSNQTLMDMCGLNKKSLSRYISNLIEAGYIEKREGKGRGNISIYYITKKGDNLIPFNDKKRGQNDTEKGTKMSIKGDNLTPINKGIIKENKESDGVMREAHTTPLSNTTTLNFENMEDFNLFWELYPGDPDWSHEKENCERVWYTLQQNWRDNLIQQLRNGQRWRERENDNPYWYLKNYNGETIKIELPFVWNGSAQITKWLNAGQQLAVMRYKDGDREGCIYCLAKDRGVMEAAGAIFLRYMSE